MSSTIARRRILLVVICKTFYLPAYLLPRFRARYLIEQSYWYGYSHINCKIVTKLVYHSKCGKVPCWFCRRPTTWLVLYETTTQCMDWHAKPRTSSTGNSTLASPFFKVQKRQLLLANIGSCPIIQCAGLTAHGLSSWALAKRRLRAGRDKEKVVMDLPTSRPKGRTSIAMRRRSRP